MLDVAVPKDSAQCYEGALRERVAHAECNASLCLLCAFGSFVLTLVIVPIVLIGAVSILAPQFHLWLGLAMAALFQNGRFFTIYFMYGHQAAKFELREAQDRLSSYLAAEATGDRRIVDSYLQTAFKPREEIVLAPGYTTEKLEEEKLWSAHPLVDRVLRSLRSSPKGMKGKK